MSEEKRFLLATLCVAGRPIASGYGILYKGTFYFIRAGVNYSDPGCEDFSPGQALVYNLIKYCFEKKIKRFDFNGPCYPYEAHWTKTINRKNRIIIFNRRKLGVKLCVLFKKGVDVLIKHSVKNVLL